ncbi:unnamed protein product, partial [Polarella glacialis]
MEETKAGGPDIVVRYALSAFEDLNSAIKNLRRCFGFPYQEYIGYINTLTQSHRARREHEVLIDRLRRWAIFGNVDAVFWIDYAKANQPPGSFKMGPRESCPFSPAHLQICSDLFDGFGAADNDADESEEACSEPDQEQQGHHGSMEPPAMQGSRNGSVQMTPREPGTLRPFPMKRNKLDRSGVRPIHSLHQPELAPGKSTSSPATAALANEEADEPGSDQARASPACNNVTNVGLQDEREQLRKMLQEEVVPAPGSIYTRSIVPGPGYYGIPRGPKGASEDAPSFGRKQKGRIDIVMDLAKRVPGPGEYGNGGKAEMAEIAAKLGRFNKADKLVATELLRRKLPFISKSAAASE